MRQGRAEAAGTRERQTPDDSDGLASRQWRRTSLGAGVSRRCVRIAGVAPAPCGQACGRPDTALRPRPKGPAACSPFPSPKPALLYRRLGAETVRPSQGSRSGRPLGLIRCCRLAPGFQSGVGSAARPAATREIRDAARAGLGRARAGREGANAAPPRRSGPLRAAAGSGRCGSLAAAGGG